MPKMLSPTIPEPGDLRFELLDMAWRASFPIEEVRLERCCCINTLCGRRDTACRIIGVHDRSGGSNIIEEYKK